MPTDVNIDDQAHDCKSDIEKSSDDRPNTSGKASTKALSAAQPQVYGAKLNPVAQAAAQYHAAGLSPIPIKPASKEPAYKSRAEFRLNPVALNEQFSARNNIGIELGGISGGLCDMDLDWPLAARIADKLEAAGLITKAPTFGRSGKPRSHRIVRISDKHKSVKFSLPLSKERAIKLGLVKEEDDIEHALMVAELRGENNYTVFPPGIHKGTGEKIAWTGGDIQGNIKAAHTIMHQDVLRELGLIAFLSVVIRFYPAEGNRQEVAMALGGALLNAGFTEENAREIVGIAAEEAGDDETKMRVNSVHQTAVKFGNGQEVTGLKRLCEHLGIPDCLKTLKKWIKRQKTEIELQIDELARMPRHEYTISPERDRIAKLLNRTLKELNELVAYARDELEAEDNPDFLKYREEAVEFMNDRHALIANVGGKTRVLSYIDDTLSVDLPEGLKRDAKLISYQTISDVKAIYENTRVIGAKDSFAAAWHRSPKRLTFEQTIFDPSREGHFDNKYNLWKGFIIVPTAGDWSLMDKHINDVLAMNDPTKYEYILKWGAWGIQNPHLRAEVALVLVGAKGVGKTLYLSQIGKMYGRHAITISNKEHLVGKFNARLEDCCFAIIEEAFHAGDKQTDSIMKVAITGEELLIERKNIDVYKAVNRLKIGMTSNYEWVVPATENERRYAFMNVSAKYAKNAIDEPERLAYFNALHKQMDSGGREAMLHYFQNYDLKGWHPREHVPDTEGLRAQIERGLSYADKFVRDCLMKGYLPGHIQNRRGHKPNTIRTTEIADDLLKSFSYSGERMSENILADAFKNVGAKKLYVEGYPRFVFPSLQEARANWDRRFGKQEWPSHTQEWLEIAPVDFDDDI